MDNATIAVGIEEVCKACKGYESMCIFNVDETGLFNKLLPRRSCLVRRKSRKTVQSAKNMASRDRVIAYICGNADGSAKIPLALIDTANEPRCFNIWKPPVHYCN